MVKVPCYGSQIKNIWVSEQKSWLKIWRYRCENWGGSLYWDLFPLVKLGPISCFSFFLVKKDDGANLPWKRIISDFVSIYLVQLYVSVILGFSCNYACTPLFFELASEVAYPVGEGVVAGLMTCMWTIVGIIFLSMFFIKNIGKYCYVSWPMFLSTIEYEILTFFDCSTGGWILLNT